MTFIQKHSAIAIDSSKNIIRKSFNNKGRKDNPRSHKTFYKELNILQKLEKNFINEPKINHYPFPKIVSYSKVPDSRNKMHFTMNYCGINALENTWLVKTQQNIQPNNLYSTIQCIINNLTNNLIHYSDFKANNICIDNHGHIALIDFGRYDVMKKNKSNKLIKLYTEPNNLKDQLYNYVECTEQDHLMTKALEIDPNFLRTDGRPTPKWKHPLFKTNPWSILYMF